MRSFPGNCLPALHSDIKMLYGLLMRFKINQIYALCREKMTGKFTRQYKPRRRFLLCSAAAPASFIPTLSCSFYHGEDVNRKANSSCKHFLLNAPVMTHPITENRQCFSSFFPRLKRTGEKTDRSLEKLRERDISAPIYVEGSSGPDYKGGDTSDAGDT